MSTASVAPASTVSPSASQAVINEPGRHWLIKGVFALVVLIGVLVVLYAWRLAPFSGAVIETENALVRGQVTVIGTQLSGYVDEVLVQDFQHVKRGQLLARIDARNVAQRIAQAQAQVLAQKAALANWPQQRSSAHSNIALAGAALASALAQADKSKADLARADLLASDGSLSVREQDQSKALRAQAVASVAQGRAALDIARSGLRSVTVNRDALIAAVANAEAILRATRVDLDNTEIRAPVDGQLGQVSVRHGAYVNAGAQLMGLVPGQHWVIANFKETQFNRLQLGQSAIIKVDALDGATLRGHVERVAPATGGEFSVLPADNATGNFIKIAQRIPVRISVDPGQAASSRLRPGMSVVVSVDTGRQP